MAAKKKCKIRLFATKVCALFGGFVAVNAVGQFFRYKSVMRKMKKHSEENNSYSSVFLGKEEWKVNADVQNIYLTSLTGEMNLVFEDVPTHKDINIDICTVFGKVILNLPAGSKVEYTGTGCFEKIVDDRCDDDTEKDITIHIVRNNFMATILVQ